eukprot:Blabericola_migrator_1__12287@NODE_767_length_6600_cov_269_135925_g220_i1_p3_GENE_NODE_767_length_6600_cov_269_135925_g220_i1NODE_767_length_6600_cov_269_135925_g220_i1_p3_ORF_typecomplete_len294_score43_32_NODE_767_length_6600_cov_269_135925_g220_i156416522
MRGLLPTVLTALTVGRAQGAKQQSQTPVLLWSSNTELFNNEEISKRTPYSQVFEILMESLSTVPDSTPYLMIHMLPRGIKSSDILQSEDEQAEPPKVLSDLEYGSHLLFPNVTKEKPFDLTEQWAELYRVIHIPAHADDKKRIAILTNRDVQEDDEAYKVLVPENGSFTFDNIADRMGDTRILLVEAAALLESTGAEADYWTILSALIGDTKKELLVVSADIDPPIPRGRKAPRRKLQSVEPSEALQIKPVQLAVLLFLAMFSFAIVAAVLCTMQVSTPALYLDKPIPINKEF